MSEHSGAERPELLAFDSTQTLRAISSSEIRDPNQQKWFVVQLGVSNRLQFLYQGKDPNAGVDYIRLPWRMGLLTQTNSSC